MQTYKDDFSCYWRLVDKLIYLIIFWLGLSFAIGVESDIQQSKSLVKYPVYQMISVQMIAFQEA